MPPPPDVHRLRDRLEAQFRKAFPVDLAERPLLILLASELGKYRRGCSTYAFVHDDLHHWARPGIDPARWRSAACAMVIADERIAEDFDGDDFATVFRNVTVHEFAHVLQRLQRPRTSEPGAFIRDVESRLYDRMLNGEVDVAGECAERPPFDGHGAEFIRASIHVCWRLNGVGLRIPPAAICGGDRWRLSRADAYTAALGRWERKGLQRLPVSTILRDVPAPESFAALYRDDVQSWQRETEATVRKLTAQLEHFAREGDGESPPQT
jgi:hypothetical protein